MIFRSASVCMRPKSFAGSRATGIVARVMSAPGLDVLLEHLAEVHAVELIAAEDDVVLVRVLEEIAEVLPHGVGGALVPARVRGRLLRGEDLDEAAGEIVELVGAS